MTGKSISRSCEDADETVLNAAEVKAIAASNPLVAEKMEVDNEVIRLKLLKANWNNERVVLDRNINENYPRTIAYCKEKIENVKKDIELSVMELSKDFSIVLDGKYYDERAKAGEVLLILAKVNEINKNESLKIGVFRSLDVLLYRSAFDQVEILLKGKSTYTASMSDSEIGNILRLENLVEKMPAVLKSTEQKLQDTLIQLDEAKREASKDFEFEDRLTRFLARQVEINTKLEFEQAGSQDVVMDDSREEEEQRGEFEVAELECAYSAGI